MAIKLTTKTNTEPASTNYPYGQIKDKTSSVPGTPVNVATYGDFHQFFEKLMAAAGITHNNIPDNAGDGFQLYEALLKVMQGEDWNKVDLYDNVLNYVWFRKGRDGFVYITGIVHQSGAPLSLPVGYRPASNLEFMSSGVKVSGDIAMAIALSVETTGLITCPLFGIGAGNVNLILVNYSFKAA
jgi:hypothetical protein